MIFNTVETDKLGITKGKVILKSFPQNPMPSTAAASYRAPSMLCNPDKTQKVTKGMVTKIPTQHYQAKKAAGDEVQFT